jgi:hypothetical protein
MLYKNIKNVLRNKKYLALFTTLTILFSIGSYYLTIYNIVNLDNFIYVNGMQFSIIYFALSFLTSALLGLYLSLFFYKYNKFRNVDYRNSTTGFFGAVVGTLGSGCAGCSVSLFSGVASFAGLSLGLASLPLNGLELKMFSVLFLFGANFIGFKNLDKRICRK